MTTKKKTTKRASSRTYEAGETTQKKFAKSSKKDGKPRVNLNAKARGVSGVEYSGGIYTADHFQEVQGPEGAKFYSKMVRQDTNCAMLLNAVRRPILSAKFSVPDSDEVDDKVTNLVRYMIFQNPAKAWKKQLNEILLMVKYGYTMFERRHVGIVDSPVGPHTRVDLLYRSPETIDRFNFDQDEKLLTAQQQTTGDVSRNVGLDAKFLTFFTVDEEGSNMCGESLLRPCVGPFKRKQNTLKIKAAGEEKYAFPFPTCELPDQPTQDDINAVKEALGDYTTNRAKFVMHPKGFKVEYTTIDFDSTRLDSSADSEDKRMAKAFNANFLELGMSKGQSSSRSFGETTARFYLYGLQYIADIILAVYNNQVIREIVDLNFGPQKVYPEMIVSGITDKDAEQLSNAINAYIEKGVIVPDEPLEVFVRENLNLPKIDTDTSRKAPQPAEGETEPTQGKESKKNESKTKSKSSKKTETPKEKEKESETKAHRRQAEAFEAKLAKTKEKVSNLINSEAAGLRVLMKKHTKSIGKKLIDEVITEYKKSKSHKAATGLSVSKDDRKALLDAFEKRLMKTAKKAHDDVVKETKLASVPKKAKERAQAQAEYVVDAHLAELKNVVVFTFSGIVDDTDDVTELGKEMELAVEELKERQTVAAAMKTTAAKVVGETRRDHFFDEDILSQIESFTAYNPSPVTKVCKELNGVTLAANDSRLNDWWNPLHFNCDTTWLANVKGDSANPPLTEDFSLSDAAQKQINL